MEWTCFHKIQSLKSHLCGLCSPSVRNWFSLFEFSSISCQSIESLLLKFENQSLCKHQSSLFSAEMKRIPIAFIWIFVMSFIWNKHINSEKSTMEKSSFRNGRRWNKHRFPFSFLLTEPIVEYWKLEILLHWRFHLENCVFWQHSSWEMRHKNTRLKIKYSIEHHDQESFNSR